MGTALKDFIKKYETQGMKQEVDEVQLDTVAETDYPEPVKKFRLILTENDESLEGMYYWFLEAYKQTSKNFLVFVGFRFQPVRDDVVDIFDKHNVNRFIVQVVDQRSVSSGAEQQGSVGIAERLVVLIHRQGIGRWLLDRMGDTVHNVELFLIIRLFFCQQPSEFLDMLGRKGEMYMSRMVYTETVIGSFDKMLLNGRSRTCFV